MSISRQGAAPILFLAAISGSAQAAEPMEVYEITVKYETTSKSDDGSTGSSRGGFLYREEVYSLEGECRIRRFDIIDDPNRPRPLVAWEMPIEVRECAGQAPAIANREAMLERLDAFLAAAKIPREACGSYYITWNVFKIECDPETVLDTVAAINLAAIPLDETASYAVPSVGTRVKLMRSNDAEVNQRIWKGNAMFSPETLREKAVGTTMIVAEVSGEELSQESAAAQLKGLKSSGEAEVTLFVGPEDGQIALEVISEVRETNAVGETDTRRGKQVTTRKRVEALLGSDPSNSGQPN